MSEPSADNWKAEYREASECFRVYTVFLISILKGVTGGNAVLFAALVYFTRGGFESNITTFLLAVLGILASVGGIGLQSRTYRLWRLFISRAAEIEKESELHLFTQVNSIAAYRRIPSSIVVLIIYGVLTVFWLVVLFKSMGFDKISLYL